MIYNYWTDRLNEAASNFNVKFDVYTSRFLPNTIILRTQSDQCPLPGGYFYCYDQQFTNREKLLDILNKLISELKINELFLGTSQEDAKKQKNPHKNRLCKRRNPQFFHEIEISLFAE